MEVNETFLHCHVWFSRYATTGGFALTSTLRKFMAAMKEHVGSLVRQHLESKQYKTGQGERLLYTFVNDFPIFKFTMGSLIPKWRYWSVSKQRKIINCLCNCFRFSRSL